MAIVDGPDRFQRRHVWLGFPLAVVYKFFDDFGTYLAAILDLLRLRVAVPAAADRHDRAQRGAAGRPAPAARAAVPALKSFPVVGQELGKPKHLSGGPAGVIIGIIGSVYGALGVAQAFQYAHNTIWAVPRNTRPNPLPRAAAAWSCWP